jgi:hypothetical protein
MKISVDVDGVLFDIMILYCEIFNKRFNTNYNKNDVSQWDFFIEWNIEKETAFTIFREIYKSNIRTPLTDPNAPMILEKLNKTNKIDIVSARTEKFSQQLKIKLSAHGIEKGTHYDQLILVDDTPKDIKLHLNYDVYVDDNPFLAEAIKNVKNSTLLLYKQPWNRMIKSYKNIRKVNNWNEIYDYIIQLRENI